MVLSRLESATTPNEPTEVDRPTIVSDGSIDLLLAELIPDYEPAGAGPAPAPSTGRHRGAERGIGDAPAVMAAAQATGRIIMALGVLLLLFAAFQLWGTGFAEANAQDDLTARFEQDRSERQGPERQGPERQGPEQGGPGAGLDEPARAVIRVSDRDDPTMIDDPLVVEISEPIQPEQAPTAYQAPTIQPDQAPTEYQAGEPVGVLSIPSIGVQKTVAEGTSRDVLRSGPGHYPSTPLPGGAGNVAIAGHRTTHGAPFMDIDRLTPGDEITFETHDGTYTYTVDGHDDGAGNQVGHMIVSPDDVGVIADRGDSRLTLTACHPKYSARQRIIVSATLVSGPAVFDPSSQFDPAALLSPEPTTPPPDVPAPDIPEPAKVVEPAAPAAAMTESLGWQPNYGLPTGLWAAAAASIAAAALLLGRLWRRFPAYALASPPLVLALFYCFSNLERLIPAV